MTTSKNKVHFKFVDNVIVPASEAIREQTRGLGDLPGDLSPGAREISLLTAISHAHAKALPKVCEALANLEHLEDWSGKFLVADRTDYDWRTAPWRKYESFADFYQRECAPVWGSWSELQETYQQLTSGDITEPDALERIQTNAATARERVQAAAIGTKVEDKMAPHRPSESDLIRHLQSQTERAKTAGMSRDMQRKIDYLADRRPDLLAQVQAGKIATSKAYDIARGIHKTPLTALQSAWRKADQDAKSTFLEWIEDNP